MGELKTTDKIFVAGHRGLVGSALVEGLRKKGYDNLLLKTRQELDLEDQSAVFNFYKKEKPTVVFVAAAKVGGIVANNTYRADFIYQNLVIQNNLIWGAHQHDVRRLVFLGSSCIYPKNLPQPMNETVLLTGEMEYTNRPYAIAKIAGMELVESLRQQYKRDYFSVMPTNLYGPGDNFDPEKSHVVPGLIRRFLEAKKNNAPSVTIWGTGSPQRELMYTHDCAGAIIFLAERLTQAQLSKLEVGKKGWSHINIGSGAEVSIANLAKMIAKLVGYTGTIVFDTSKPDGVKRKLLDTTVLHELGWHSATPLNDGLKMTIDWFKQSIAPNDSLPAR